MLLHSVLEQGTISATLSVNYNNYNESIGIHMKLLQNRYSGASWQTPLEPNTKAQLIFAFGDRDIASSPAVQSQIHASYPNATLLGCTTAGEILGKEISDHSLAITAIELEKSRLQVVSSDVLQQPLEEACRDMVSQLDISALKYVLVLADGQLINGTELVEHLQSLLPNGTILTGGLAADDTRFEETKLFHNQDVSSGKILLCALSGDHLQLSHGSIGGWDPFGPKRRVTKSDNNVLYSLDDKPALSLYKTYLGDHAKDLPASALLFPLLVTRQDKNDEIIRTILNIDEDNEAMIFAGDIPEGSTAQFMRANFERLIDGAEEAAGRTLKQLPNEPEAGLVLMVSCVGRRLVLGQRTEEEVEAVVDMLGQQHAYTGFYSYGEISPVANSENCDLHNQTMTITFLSEQV